MGILVAQTTKRALEASLKKLLLKKPLNKITINDITEDCGVNRMTFTTILRIYTTWWTGSWWRMPPRRWKGRQNFETWSEALLDALNSASRTTGCWCSTSTAR